MLFSFDFFLSQWRIQDFPEGGREPSRGGVNTPNFPENCMKSKEFGRPGGGACVPHAPLDPPMFLMMISKYKCVLITSSAKFHNSNMSLSNEAGVAIEFLSVWVDITNVPF